MPRTPLRMPKMSMTMEEGELGTWLVAVGDTVESGQPVCEVATDKVDMEVESTATGTIVELAVEPGTTVPVGAPLAWIDTETDSLLDDLLDGDQTDTPGTTDAARPAEDTGTDGPGTTEAPTPRTDGGIVPAIPRARRLAAENSLDLRSVEGTGPGGAVLVGDVQQVLDASTDTNTAPAPAPATSPEPAPVPVAAIAAPAPQPAPQPQPAAQPEDGPDAWAARAAALAPRPARAGQPVTASRDVVLGPVAEVEESRLWAALALALTRALAAEATAGIGAGSPVPSRPRIGLAVPTLAGTLTVTLPELRESAGAGIEAAQALAADAVSQARSGRVDITYLGHPDAVVSVHTGVDRISPPPPASALLEIAAGSATQRVVAVDGNLGVRTAVTLSASSELGRVETSRLAAILARVAADLPGLAGLVPLLTGAPKAG